MSSSDKAPLLNTLLQRGDLAPERYLDRSVRTFYIRMKNLINTGALARWRNSLAGGELFQQFIRIRVKPLKRLLFRGTSLHRAKAPVLMKTGLNECEISKFTEVRFAAAPAFALSLVASGMLAVALTATAADNQL